MNRIMINRNENICQQDMEDFLEFTLKNNNETLEDSINGMMCVKDLKGSVDEGWIEMTFPVQSWQENRIGRLQGGVYSIAMDIAASAVARFFNKAEFSPTVELSVKYLGFVKTGDELVIRSTLIRKGKTLTYTESKGYSKDTGRIVLTGSAVFMSSDSEAQNNNVNKKKFSGGYLKDLMNNSDRF